MNNKNSSLNQLKKKLFILAGYVLATGLLFVYVSYSQYKISMTATVYMPEMYSMQAGIGFTGQGADAGLQDEPTKTASAALDGFLSRLVPGNDAKTYASSGSDSSHKLIIRVDNRIAEADDQGGAGGNDDDDELKCGELDIKYTLKIRTDGILPLEFVLVDKGTTYSAVTTHSGVETTVTLKDANGKEPIFYLSGGAIDAYHDFNYNDHELFIGWNNESKRDIDRDVSLCKELDKIVITADVTGLPADRAQYAESLEVVPSKVYDVEDVADPVPNPGDQATPPGGNTPPEPVGGE